MSTRHINWFFNCVKCNQGRKSAITLAFVRFDRVVIVTPSVTILEVAKLPSCDYQMLQQMWVVLFHSNVNNIGNLVVKVKFSVTNPTQMSLN